jgi:hypothetical protein
MEMNGKVASKTSQVFRNSLKMSGSLRDIHRRVLVLYENQW